MKQLTKRRFFLKYYELYTTRAGFVINSKKIRTFYEKKRLQFMNVNGIIKILGYYAEIYSLK